MKKVLLSLALLVSSVAFSDWGGATGGPAHPQICIRNRTAYTVQIYVNQQPTYVSPHQFRSYYAHNFSSVLLAMNTRQLQHRSHPAWVQQYVNPSQFGCDHSNTVAIYQYGNVLGFQ